MKSSSKLFLISTMMGLSCFLISDSLYIIATLLSISILYSGAVVCQCIEGESVDNSDDIEPKLPPIKPINSAGGWFAGSQSAPRPRKYDRRNGNGYQPVKQPMDKQEFIGLLTGMGWTYHPKDAGVYEKICGPDGVGNVVWPYSCGGIFANGIQYHFNLTDVYERILKEQLNINIPEPKPPESD